MTLPRDSGGTYTLPGGSTATTGTTILASEHNTPLGDIASALTGSLPVDGSKGMSGVLKVADGTAANPSIAFGSDTTTGFYKKAAGILGYSAGGLDTPLSVPTGVILPYGGIVTPAGWLRTDGSAISRTTYAALFAALSATGNATKDGTATLNSVDTDFTSYGLVGAYVEGTGIAVGTKITALTVSTITLSATPTGTGAIAIRILPHGQGDGSTNFNLPDPTGRSISGRESTATRLTTAVSGINGASLGASGGSQSVALVQANLPSVSLSTTISDTRTFKMYGSANTSHDHSGSSGPTYDGVGAGTLTTSLSIASWQSGGSISGSTPLGGSRTGVNKVPPTLVLNYIIKT